MKKLDSRGIAHDVILIAFVAIFAIAGVAYLVASHADSCDVVSGPVTAPPYGCTPTVSQPVSSPSAPVMTPSATVNTPAATITPKASQSTAAATPTPPANSQTTATNSTQPAPSMTASKPIITAQPTPKPKPAKKPSWYHRVWHWLLGL